MDSILHNLQIINEKIHRATLQNGRNPEDIKLVLATKTVSPERIITALSTGEKFIGENKIQEIISKYDDLQTVPHKKHFIGHLQTNKIKDIIKYDVACIESVDRLDLAQKLQQRLTLENKSMDILIQVNTSGESSKFGVRPENTLDLVRSIASMDRLHIKGLMTIGIFSDDHVKVRKCFKLLKQIRDQIAIQHIAGVEMKELSMGMSGDFEIAIEEGATIVRIGTAIFGKRIYPDSYYWNESK
ncbi:MAG: YggS family pyridoxal phosphate-dependent enzyme [Saprospiraceae bacterium]|nr:MAG: alanine racemase [Bacteroidetes bacterium OLB9]MCO6463228.1 YggS family pyridoxal phosphate-dependent enzyme [Saprospiraceae bacterium]MCZ2338347.1 YggS family pyridoxal phosphate-dependent enzyme [Chitinophagales bacterium]